MSPVPSLFHIQVTNMHNCFHAADILLPQHISMRKWACVACDQFSSQPEYWREVEDFVGDAPSTMHMILPEAFLSLRRERIPAIHRHMEEYLSRNLFRTFRRSFLYLERTLADGSRRRGLVGQVGLENYDFHPGSGALIRATEATVEDRLPPRMEVIRQAKLELSHVLMLSNDRRDMILTAAASVRGEQVYDFDLMQDGGRITGWVISGLGVSVVNAAVSDYIAASEEYQGPGPMAFAVGDGNHSLAAAKACWEELKPTLSGDALLEHPARFALVELGNIHDPAVRFEAIHRTVSGIDPGDLSAFLRAHGAETGHPITLVTAAGEETVYLPENLHPLPIGALQPLLDEYVSAHGGTMDYIHGAEVVRSLAGAEDTLGLILPAMDKAALFPGVLKNGVLPRKTFSMGEAREKRYYLEAKRRQ